MRFLLSTSVVALLITYNSYAQTCQRVPDCASLGYTKTASDCSGRTYTVCPFDTTKYSCDTTTCEELGFTDTVAECSGEYNVCQYEATKGKCIYDAHPGDLKYSLRTSDHDGWLLCNGRLYDKFKYPELYSAISESYGTKLPLLTDYFIKGAATTSASNLKPEIGYGKEDAGLPNIYGTFGQLRGDTTTYYNSSGAFTTTSSGKSYTGYSDTTGIRITFDASKYNSIYGKSRTVTPQNYKANVFIYAGPTKKTTDTVDCVKGAWLYNDGTCKTTYDSSKTPLGIVTYTYESGVQYTFGGNTSSTSHANADTACKNKGGTGVASGYYINQIAALGNTITSNPVIVPISTTRKYWVFSEYIYTCTESGCTSDGSTTSNSSVFYYCNGSY